MASTASPWRLLIEIYIDPQKLSVEEVLVFLGNFALLPNLTFPSTNYGDSENPRVDYFRLKESVRPTLRGALLLARPWERHVSKAI